MATLPFFSVLDFSRSAVPSGGYELSNDADERSSCIIVLIMDFIELLPYLPISLTFIVLTILGLHHFCFTSLKSPTNFQQGLNEISLFRSALNCTLIVVAPLMFVLPASSAEQIIQYLLGYGCAALLSIMLISPVLHYNPSPSVCYYIKLRFNQSLLYVLVFMLNIILLSMLSVIMLTMTVSFITRSSALSPYKICTILGYINIFAIAFGGQTSVSSNTFFLLTCIIVLGIAFLIFNGFTDHIYFMDIISTGDYVVFFNSWTAFCLGVLNGLHLIITSPLLYQQYFSLSSCNRLRKSLTIHLLLFVILTAAILMSPELFANQSNWFCPEIPSLFLNFNLNYNSLYLLLITILLVFTATFSSILILLALISLIWEDLLRPLLLQCSFWQQMGLLQIGLLIVGSIIIALSNIWLYVDKPLRHGPISFLILCTLAAPLTALYICSYLFPFMNGKGATIGLIAGISCSLSLFYLYFQIMPSRFLDFPKPCFNGTALMHSTMWLDYKFAYSEMKFTPSMLQSVVDETRDLLPILSEIPVEWYPMTSFTVTSIMMVLISLCTSNYNFYELNWNLVVCAPYARIFIRHNIIDNRRTSVFEFESSWYALILDICQCN